MVVGYLIDSIPEIVVVEEKGKLEPDFDREIEELFT